MEYIIWGTVFTIAAVVLVWLGVRRRQSVKKGYERDVKKYTASTMMKVVWIDESEVERWEDREDGSSVLTRETFYLPTYEYTVGGRTYRYFSRQSLSSKKELGRQVPGYYDPSNPEDITENRIRKPIFGGFGFFLLAAFMLFFAVNTFAGNVSIS